MRLPVGACSVLKRRSACCLRAWLSAALAIVLMLGHPAATGADGPASILFVSSHTSSHYLHFVEEARRTLDTTAPERFAITSLPASQLVDTYRTGASGSFDMVVALGTQAARVVNKWRPAAPVLYALIPEASYESLKRSGDLACPSGQCTAIYIDQPLPRLFTVLDAAFAGQRRLGVLLGPTSSQQQSQLAELAGKQGLSLHTALVNEADDLLPALDGILKQSDVLLSIADPLVYNRHTAKSILLTTYRYKVPLLAYSKAYADAGAALSVYSTPRQISRQAAGIIKAYFAGNEHRLPPPQYPQSFKIRINRHVADSLGLDLEHHPKLQSIIKDADDEQAEYSK